MQKVGSLAQPPDSSGQVEGQQAGWCGRLLSRSSSSRRPSNQQYRRIVEKRANAALGNALLQKGRPKHNRPLCRGHFRWASRDRRAGLRAGWNTSATDIKGRHAQSRSAGSSTGTTAKSHMHDEKSWCRAGRSRHNELRRHHQTLQSMVVIGQPHQNDGAPPG